MVLLGDVSIKTVKSQLLLLVDFQISLTERKVKEMGEPQYSVECDKCKTDLNFISTEELPDTIENKFYCKKCRYGITIIHYI